MRVDILNGEKGVEVDKGYGFSLIIHRKATLAPEPKKTSTKKKEAKTDNAKVGE